MITSHLMCVITTYRKSQTRDRGRLGATQDMGPHKWDPGPQYDQVGAGTRDPLSGTNLNHC